MNRILIAVTIGLLVLANPSQAFFGRTKVVDITIKTVDSAGNPVPWVTVGAAFEAENIENLRKGGSSVWLKKNDPYRVLNQYEGAWEYWNDFRDPLPALIYTGITDERGVREYKFDEDDWLKKSPGAIDFGFAAYRQGLKPAQAIVTAPKNAKKLEVTIVMEKADDAPEKLPAYLERFYQERATLDPIIQPQNVNKDYGAKLNFMRDLFMELAEEAHKAGDHRNAGLIMYWTGIHPSINVYEGQVTGYSNTREEEFFPAISKALEYDPENDFLRAQFLIEQYQEFFRSKHTYEQLAQFLQSWIKEMEALDKKSGYKLWPIFHHYLSSYYVSKEKNIQKGLDKKIWLHNFEPRWERQDSFEKSLEFWREQLKQAEVQKQNTE